MLQCLPLTCLPACGLPALQLSQWRPTTAVRARDDPTWSPQLAVAAHPEYPSAHQAVFGGAWCAPCHMQLSSQLAP